MSHLIDTNVLSELRKGAGADPGVRRWVLTQPEPSYISALTVGEIRMGIERRRRRDPMSARPLEVWLAGLLLNFSSRVLPVTQAIAERWGRLAVPDPLPVVNGLIAATAIEHGLTLVTRNVADMERTGVTILNPFSGPG